jgi:hypothetical protein
MARVHDAIEINGRKHDFHAEARILSGHLHMPLMQKIEPQTEAHLYPKGGYIAEHADLFRVEGVISFNRAYTQVAGNRGRKAGHGWATLTTTVVEGLNVLEILTCDRVVGQIITEHPQVGYVPHISFLGTRFENLKIAGHPVKVDVDLNVIGAKPSGDAGYAKHPSLVTRVKKQYANIHEREDAPAELRAAYNQLSSTLETSETIECSLVHHVTGSFPGIAFGNILKIPDFGTVELAKLKITHEDYNGNGIPELTTVDLTMLDLTLGCAIDGNVPIGSGSSNGRTRP